MSSTISTPDEKVSTESDILSETIPLPLTSPLSPSPSPGLDSDRGISARSISDGESMEDIPSPAEDVDTDYRGSIACDGPNQALFDAVDYLDGSTEGETTTGQHEPDRARQDDESNTIGVNPTEATATSEFVSERTATLLNRTRSLSPTAPSSIPSDHSTITDSPHDVGGSTQTSKPHPGSSTPISQISAIAAEVADTAAMLDATPVEAATPDFLSILGGMRGVDSGSPVVELVEEAFTSISEASRVAAEVADTAAMLDCSLDGWAGGGVEEHVGVVRMVRVGDECGEGLEGCLEKVDAAEEVGSERGQSALVVEERLGVDGGCVGSLGLASTMDCESSAGMAASLVAGVGENASDKHTENLPEILGRSFSTTPTRVNPDNTTHESTGDYSSMIETPVVEAVEDINEVLKTYPAGDGGPQKNKQSQILPHLRKGFEQKCRLDASDSESSMISAMSDLSTGQLEKGVTTDDFVNSILPADLDTIASNVYAESYGVATGTVDCVVSPPRINSRNVFYVVEFSEKESVRKNKWMFRIPLHGCDFSRADKLWLESDIWAMEFIKERTDIPIPYIYGYDDGIQNIIGTPYVLMDFMEGNRVGDVWESFDEEKKSTCLLQCAESMCKLGRFGFNSIGVLGCDVRKERYVVRGIPSYTEDKGLSFAGPFPSTKAYLDHIWGTKVAELRDSSNLEAVKNRQSLILLKLLAPNLVDLEPENQEFFLSLPEFGDGNVLVDDNGNVTGIIGWEKVVIMPKAMGYARYPDWIIKDWISSQEKSQVGVQQPERENTKNKTVSIINRKSLAKASLDSGKTIETVMDSEGVIRGYLLEEGEGVPGETVSNPKTPAPLSPPEKPKNGNDLKEENDSCQVSQADENGTTDTLGPSSSQTFPRVSIRTDGPVPDDEPSTNSGRWKKKKGRKEGYKNKGGNKKNSRSNRQQPAARQRQEYDENVELQRAITDEDKIKVHAISKWNALPEEIIQKEAEEREERKQARLTKGEEEKAAGIKKETPMLPKVVETFKKVVVKQNLERELLEVVKTERKDPLDETTGMEDIRVVRLPPTSKSSDVVRYRKIYHGFFMNIVPEDEVATKFSHISTAVHTAITNNDLRPFIVPRLARHVFGAAVGPNLLKMVGGGQWAKELLMKISEGGDEPNDAQLISKNEHFGTKDKIEVSNGRAWEFLILGSALIIGAVVMITGTWLMFFWILGLVKYNIQSTWDGAGYTTIANLSFHPQFPILTQSPAYGSARLAAHVLGDIFEKLMGIANLAFNYSLTLFVAVVIFIVFLTMQSKADVVE